jgi:hypothetical protein
MKNTTDRNVVTYHYLIHQETNVYKPLTVFNNLRVVWKIGNLIRSRRLNNREMKEFFSDIQPEYEDGVSYVEALWLSRGKTLKFVHDLKSETELLLEMKGEYFPRLCDRERTCEFAFCTENSQHLKENTSTHEAYYLVNEMFNKSITFERTLRLRNCNCYQKTQHTSKFWDWESPQLQWTYEQNSAPWTNLLSPVFKMHANVNPQSNHLQHRLMLMLKADACSVTGTSEIRGESVRHKWQPKLN